MDKDLVELKINLKSLAVSCPVEMDMKALLRDYRNMVGQVMPIHKWGYTDPALFLKEKCSDCFLISGPHSNLHLTLIVTDSIKHIDRFVQKQKMSSAAKYKGKRTSVLESSLKPKPSLVADTFAIVKNQPQTSNINQTPNGKSSENYDNKENTNMRPIVKETKKDIDRTCNDIKNVENKKIVDKVNDKCSAKAVNNDKSFEVNHKDTDNNNKVNDKSVKMYNDNRSFEESKIICNRNDKMNGKCAVAPFNNSKNVEEAKNIKVNSQRSLQSSCQSFRNGTSNKSRKTSDKEDVDSGRQTASSSGSSSKQAIIHKLKGEIVELLSEHPDGVLCTDLIRLYREKYKHDLAFLHIGYTSILSLFYDLGLKTSRPQGTDEWWVVDPKQASNQKPLPVNHTPKHPRTRKSNAVDPEDALPGIQYDPDVFPSDCLHIAECIPESSVAGLSPGAMLEVVLGEVYSPSHFWLIRLGEGFSIAMDEIMDEMTQYYTHGEGRDRHLALGAVQVGQYCASVYDGDYHRSLIVKVLDSDTVKVRHVDYATVETQSVYRLKPLLRRWAALPAQALRARLAGVRPSAQGRRWPHAAGAYFLAKVNNKKLVANVLAVEFEENLIEVILVDTSTEDDICIGTELIKAGHADGRADSALRTSESYLYPRFEALETAATPNYAEIYNYLSHGIALEYVDDYRRHVPSCVPSGSPPPLVDDDPAPPAPPPSPTHPLSPAKTSPPLSVLNRVPLRTLASSSPTSALSSCAENSQSPESFPVKEEPLNNNRSVESGNYLPDAKPLPRPESTSSMHEDHVPSSKSLNLMSFVSPPVSSGLAPRAPYPISKNSQHVFRARVPYSDLNRPGVMLTFADWEIYTFLSKSNASLACQFMADALERNFMLQRNGSWRSLNPSAEFRFLQAPTHLPNGCFPKSFPPSPTSRGFRK